MEHKKLRGMQRRVEQVRQDIFNNPWANEQDIANCTKTTIPPTAPPPTKVYSMSAASPAFSCVAAAFDFTHHPNTDPTCELQVLKTVLRREGLLTKLFTFAEEQGVCGSLEGTLDGVAGSSGGGDMVDCDGVSVLVTLTTCRDATLAVCECVAAWRVASGAATLPFYFHGDNYLNKCRSDVDFLADCEVLVNALKVEGERMVGNPLMLPNNLREPVDVSADEALRGEMREMRVRLREAERMLIEEEGRGGNNEGEEENYEEEEYEDDAPEPARAALGPAGSDAFSSAHSYGSLATEQSEAYSHALAAWYDKAQAQLLALSQPIQGPSMHNSRGLLGEPKAREKTNFAR